MIAPTVRHAIRISSHGVDFAVCVTSHAACVSVAGVVTRPRGLGEGRPVFGAVHPQRLGLEETLHRAQVEGPPAAGGPSPRSYPEARTPQRPHRRSNHDYGLTRATTAPSPSSSIDSITVARSTPSTPRHTLMSSTPPSLSRFRLSEVRKPRQGAARSPLGRAGHPRKSQESLFFSPGPTPPRTLWSAVTPGLSVASSSCCSSTAVPRRS